MGDILGNAFAEKDRRAVERQNAFDALKDLDANAEIVKNAENNISTDSKSMVNEPQKEENHENRKFSRPVVQNRLPDRQDNATRRAM